MGNYISNTDAQIAKMLEYIGSTDMSELYSDIPDSLKNGLNLPDGMSELEVRRKMTHMSEKNTVFKTIFRGAGAYRHFIPAVVDAVVRKETFLTAYTPYQAEISQGILQSIFEYQSMICALTDMEVSNASVYDGATAAAEAVAMCRGRNKTKALVSAAANPQVIETIATYCRAAQTPMELIPVKNGVTDLEAMREMAGGEAACVYIQQPNFYGMLEDAEKAGEYAHEAGAKYIMGVNPIAAAVIKTPGECGADIAVGEGQPLGMPMSFGGPYLGFMAAKNAMLRSLPGRIVGQTTDKEGRRAFVLTLQAREQHIRRERAGSNICSNQALCAMTAAVYMAAMGAGGMCEAARQSFAKAHYLAAELEKIGFALKHRGEFFHEFLTVSPSDNQKILSLLEENGILGGLPIGEDILWCATEMNTKEEIDYMVELIRKGGAR